MENEKKSTKHKPPSSFGPRKRKQLRMQIGLDHHGEVWKRIREALQSKCRHKLSNSAAHSAIENYIDQAFRTGDIQPEEVLIVGGGGARRMGRPRKPPKDPSQPQ